MKHSEQTLAKKIQRNSPYLLAGIVGGVVAIFAPFIMMIVSAATVLFAVCLPEKKSKLVE